MNVLATMLAPVKGADMGLLRRMRAICEKSYQKNLYGLERIRHIEPDKEYPNAPVLFKDRHVKARELWDEGHNVLLVDLDTVCIQPTVIFGAQHFRMFGLTNQDAPSRQDISEGHYMNAGVMYLPQSMDKRLWDIQQALLEQWDDSLWSYDQYVWNRMFWAQEVHGWFHPEMNYAEPCDNLHSGDQPNGGLRWWKANIIHFHASRNPEEALQAMRLLCD